MKKIYIAAAKRTAIGSFNGTLSTVPAPRFAAEVVKRILSDTGVPAADIREVLVGNILPAGCGQGVGRQVSIHAGLPVEVPAYSLNMACGSGMKAMMICAASAWAGLGDVFIAGGTESMSRAPYMLADARKGLGLGEQKLIDHMVYDALTDAFVG